MTVYNGMPYLRQSLQSLYDQTLQDWQCVIVDDGSTDKTKEYLQTLDDDRFTIITQTNQGTAAASNHGLKYCHTSFVARMDCDDVSLPSRLADQLEFLKQHPEVGLVGAQMTALGDSGPGSQLDLPTEHKSIMHFLMTGQHGMAHSCIMLRTDLLKQIGGYWKYNLNDAWDMMLRMGELSQLANIPRVLHHYRVYDGSQTGSRMKRMRFSIAFACDLARRRLASNPQITPEEFSTQQEARAWWQHALSAVDIHARCQYRVALAELHGNHRARGSTRMAWAALCSPQLTWQRLRRIFHRIVTQPE
jgi:glycosyltransferase involved in cell wall biosynthesis